MIIKQEGIEESELLSLPLKSQLLQRGVVQLCCLGHDYLPHFIRLVWAGLPTGGAEPSLGFSLSKVLCGFIASVGLCYSWHWSRELSNSVFPASPPSLLAFCPPAPLLTLSLEHSSD